jgi:hypothetical protein
MLLGCQKGKKENGAQVKYLEKVKSQDTVPL